MKPEHVCPFCEGSGYTPTEWDGIARCLACHGSGLAVAHGDLGPTHSQRRRPYSYAPSTRTLAIGAGKRPSFYTVQEFPPGEGFDGRAFVLHKIGHPGEHYACLLAPGHSTCDCAGKTYLAHEWANWRAFLHREDQSSSEGCKHVDALRALLEGGWLDLPEGEPPRWMIEPPQSKETEHG